jgi:LCP family protein required for cell wall assembly
VYKQTDSPTPNQPTPIAPDWRDDFAPLYAKSAPTTAQPTHFAPQTVPVTGALPHQSQTKRPTPLGEPHIQPYEQPAYIRRTPHRSTIRPRQLPLRFWHGGFWQGMWADRMNIKLNPQLRDAPKPESNACDRAIMRHTRAQSQTVLDITETLDDFDAHRIAMTSIPSEPSRKSRKKRALPAWATPVLVLFAVLALLLAGGLVYAGARNFAGNPDLSSQPKAPSFTINQSGEVVANEGNGQSSGSGSGGSVPDAGGGDSVLSFAKWQGTRRVTVLLMGIDRRREVESEKAYRTDSMMLLTIDPVGKKATILSLPRDLYVDIPGFPQGRLNTANYLGDLYELPGGGAALAMQTIETNFGIHVDYYARISFTAFETLIDQIGGIDVYVEQTIDDPTYPDVYYGFDPFHIEAGWQHLDGRTALKYARTRHTQNSDFDRAKRQQQVILAVREKITSLNNLPSLIASTPALLQTLADAYDSNMDYGQMMALGLLANDIDKASIQNYVLDTTFIIQNYITPDGQDVLIWDREKVQKLRNEIFYEPALPEPAKQTAEAPLAPEVLLALVKQENATIEILNGSGIAGLAGTAEAYLKERGFHVVATGNADRQDYASSVIIDNRGRPYATRWLVELFKISPINIFSGNSAGTAEIRLILGADVYLP